MNKSHFQLSIEEMQGQHIREMHEAAEKRAGEEDKREKAEQAEKARTREEIEMLKKGLKVSWHMPVIDGDVADILGSGD